MIEDEVIVDVEEDETVCVVTEDHFRHFLVQLLGEMGYRINSAPSRNRQLYLEGMLDATKMIFKAYDKYNREEHDDDKTPESCES